MRFAYPATVEVDDADELAIEESVEEWLRSLPLNIVVRVNLEEPEVLD